MTTEAAQIKESTGGAAAGLGLDTSGTALVMEGGGMRGVFTDGVLDYLLDAGVSFPYCVAVSAAACNGLSYLSGQRGRARTTNIDLLEKFHYIGVKYLWTQRSIFDRKLLYERIPSEILPFDYDACFANPMIFEMVTTDCRSGKACYLTEKGDPARLLEIAKASSALPYVCPIVTIDGRPMLDGGLADSIPVKRALAQGYGKCIVVLTRNCGFRYRGRDLKVPRYIYREYPRLRLLLSRRHALYNAQLEAVERLEAAGRVTVIRPQRPLEVGRLGSDTEKLERLYEEGYECARDVLTRLAGVQGQAAAPQGL